MRRAPPPPRGPGPGRARSSGVEGRTRAHHAAHVAGGFPGPALVPAGDPDAHGDRAGRADGLRGPVPTGGEIGLLFRGGADEARSMLETIAGSVITVTGIIFSIALVALRAASEQFSSRVLRNFTSDRPSQLTLGIFTATFVYSLMILRLVRPEGEAGEPFVPALSVTIAFGLALTSIGFLILDRKSTR